MTIAGMKIIESYLMTEAGEPYKVRRSWKERLFTLPWKPLQKTRTVVPQVPRKDILQMMGDTLIMHPAIAAELRRKAEECEK
jgi:hypothetical protein